jgi:hypothetical protein
LGSSFALPCVWDRGDIRGPALRWKGPAMIELTYQGALILSVIVAFAWAAI